VKSYNRPCFGISAQSRHFSLHKPLREIKEMLEGQLGRGQVADLDRIVFLWLSFLSAGITGYATCSKMRPGLFRRCVMTVDEFRNLALSLPEAAENAHMGHPDFRVRGKIFATISPDNEWGMVKLTPEQQAVFVRSEPNVYQPVKGGWG